MEKFQGKFTKRKKLEKVFDDQYLNYIEKVTHKNHFNLIYYFTKFCQKFLL